MSQPISATQLGFIGRSDELEDALKALESIPAMAVEGEAGIGKTAFLREVADQLLQQNDERALVWIDSPESGDFRLLLYSIGCALGGSGLALRERTLADLRYWVTALVHDVDAIVIIEDLHRIQDPQLDLFLRSVSNQLGHGRLLMSTREPLNIPVKTTGSLPWVTLEPLSSNQTRHFVNHIYAHAEQPPPSRDEIEESMQYLEGSPDRIRTACTMAFWARLPFKEAAMQAKGGDVLDMLVIRLGQIEQKAMGVLALAGQPVPQEVLEDLLDGKELDTETHVWDMLIERRPDGLWLPYRFRQAVRHGLRVGQRLQVHDKLNDLYWNQFKHTGHVESALRSIEHALEAGRPGDAADRFERVLPQARLEGLHARILEASRRIPDRMRASRPAITGGIYFCKAFLGDRMAVKRLEQAVEQASSDERERLFSDLAWLKRESGDVEKAIYYRQRALDESQQKGSGEAILAHRMELADMYIIIRDYQMAERLLNDSRELLMDLDRDVPAIEGKYFLCRGLLSLLGGEIRSAEKDLGRAKLTLNEALAYREVGQVDRRVGMYHYAAGNWEKAIEAFGEARETLRRSGDLIDAGVVELALAETQLLSGEKGEAGKLIAGVSQIIRGESDEYAKVLEAPMKICRARLSIFDGELEKAREQLEEAVRVYIELANEDKAAQLAREVVDLYGRDGNFFRSRDHLRKMGELVTGDALAHPKPQERVVAEAWSSFHKAQYDRAREYAELAKKSAQKTDSYLRVIEAQKCLVMIALEQLQYDLTQDLLRTLRKLRIKVDRLTPIWADTMEARVAVEKGQWERAGTMLEQVRKGAAELEYQGLSALLTYLEARVAAGNGNDKDASALGAEAYTLAKKGQSLLAAEIGFFTAGVDKRRGIPGAGDRYRREARLVMANRPDIKVLGLKVEEMVKGARWKGVDRQKVRDAAVELDADALARVWGKVSNLGLVSRGTSTLITQKGKSEVSTDFRDFVDPTAYDVVIDGSDHLIMLGKESVSLDGKRLLHNLICYLAKTAEDPQESVEIFREVWGEKYEGAESESRLETSLKRLRQLLGGPDGCGALVVTYSNGKIGLDPSGRWALFLPKSKPKRFGSAE